MCAPQNPKHWKQKGNDEEEKKISPAVPVDADCSEGGI
jgi:hypothetical protein